MMAILLCWVYCEQITAVPASLATNIAHTTTMGQYMMSYGAILWMVLGNLMDGVGQYCGRYGPSLSIMVTMKFLLRKVLYFLR